MRYAICLVFILLSPTGLSAEEPASCRSPRSSAYVPSHVEITAPGSDVPDSLARWIGHYAGHFDGSSGTLCTRLFVRSVDADGSVEVTYVWGDYPTFSSGDTDERGRIDPKSGELRFTMSRGRTNKYQMSDDGKAISVTSEYRGRTANGTLDRVASP